MAHRLISLLTALLASLLTCLAACASEPMPVRIGLVKFGTGAWEMDTIRRNALDRANGVQVSVIEMATNDAAKVALQTGFVDMIVSDWPWVARQRAEGAHPAACCPGGPTNI